MKTRRAERLSPTVESILSLLAPGLLSENETALRTEDRLARVIATSAGKPHGSRARYVSGCRCVPCRAANSRYQSERLRAQANGDWNGIVSADRARTHLIHLSEKGIGRHSVQAACDVSDSILYGIIIGARPRLRARTERRILAVDEGARGGNSIISAAATWRLLRELLRDGYSKVQLAEWLGNQRALQVNIHRVTAETASKVERMYALIQAGKLSRPLNRQRQPDGSQQHAGGKQKRGGGRET